MAARALRSPCAAPGRTGLRAAALLGLCVGTAALRAGGRAAPQKTFREPFMTYNVLAPTLSEIKRAESEAKVPGSWRWPKVFRYIETAMKASAVIALQEVAASWVKMPGGLADVFDGKGYAWRWVNSRVGVDFTGLVLAWPTAVYEWEVVHRLDLASRIPEGGGLAQELVRNLATNLLLVDLFHKSTSQLLTVATCELPPIYRPKRDPVRPIAQEIHMSLVLDTLQNISAELPAILMGDFSLSPRSPAYALAADGNEHAAKRLGALVEGLPPTRRMRSAYFECFGAEPAFTISWKNIAVTSDYIWMGDGVAAQECLRLPDRAVEWPLPNELEGSDHVPVVAMLEVGPPTGLAPDMPEVGDADIAGSFNRLVAKWSNVGKQGSGDALKKN